MARREPRVVEPISVLTQEAEPTFPEIPGDFSRESIMKQANNLRA
jgi:hypothetical protein